MHVAVRRQRQQESEQTEAGPNVEEITIDAPEPYPDPYPEPRQGE